MSSLWSKPCGAWKGWDNPFRFHRARGAPGITSSPPTHRESPDQAEELPQLTTDRLWRLITLWYGFTLILAGLMVVGGVYGVGKVRHEQELRISSRRIREAETRQRETEIRLLQVYRANQELRAQWATREASDALARTRMARSHVLLLAQD